MNSKKITALLTAAASCLSAAAAPAGNALLTETVSVYAEESESDGSADASDAVLEEGKLGESVAYTLYESGRLLIKGHGSVTEKARDTVENYDEIVYLDFESDSEGEITSLCSGAFEYCSALTEAVIPDSVTEYGTDIFLECRSLKKAVLGKGLKKFVRGIFAICTSLQEITLPGAETVCVFDENGSLTSDSLTVKSLFMRDDGYAFCELKKVTVSDGTEEIYDYTFYDMRSVTEVVLPSSLKKIGDSAFRWTSVTAAELPEGLTEIGSRAFMESTKLESINIPSTTQRIGDYAFAYTGINEVSVPDSVTEYGTGAFFECRNLKKAVLGKGLTKCVPGLLAVCTSLDELEMPDIMNKCVYDANGDITDESKTVKTMLTREDGYFYCTLRKVVVTYGAEEISPYEFAGITTLEEITIPESVKKIGTGAFELCGLKAVELPENLAEIESSAFRKCRQLEKIVIPPSVLTVGDYAFSECSEMQEAVISEGVQKIGECAFSYCNALRKITVPDSVTELGRGTFSECRGLGAVTIGKGVTGIVPELFALCTSLEILRMPALKTECVYDENGSLAPESKTLVTMFTREDGYCYCVLKTAVITDGAEKIPEGLFAGVSSLQEVFIPESVKEVSENAFLNEHNIRDLYFAGSSETWDSILNPAGNELPTGTVYHFGGAVPESERCVNPDVDGNGVVNTADITALARFLLKLSDEEEEINGDVNGDGKVNTADYVCLLSLFQSR